MKNSLLKKGFVMLVFIGMLICIGGTATSIVSAAAVVPVAVDNTQCTFQANTKLVATNNGYMRVCCDYKKIWIEYYDNNFNIKSKKSIKMELPVWGGFYESEDAYYLVEGQGNKAESFSREVVRVIKYDKNWKRIGAAKITGNPDLFGGDVGYPFYGGCVEFTECNGLLYIATGHQGYFDEYVGMGHQGYMLIAVNKENMTGKIVDSDLWHSFAQYIEQRDGYLYLLELSEGSRCTALSKLDAAKYTPETFSDWNEPDACLKLLKYGGKTDSVWATEYYASVDGMTMSSENILCIGTSINQKKANSVTENTPHNILLTVTPISKFSESATKTKMITNFKGGGKSFWGLKITKINDNRFMISWEVADVLNKANSRDLLSGNVLNYVFVDGAGNVVSKKYTAAAAISSCQPIVKGSKVVYTAATSNMVNFYSINTNNGKFSKKCYRVAGANATWNFNKGVLTISGTGPIPAGVECDPRYSLSSASNVYSARTDDTTWNQIRDRVEKIVIKPGITKIGARAFEHFNCTYNVQIGRGVKTIGKKAFYGCHSLIRINIPASVTTIGKDFLWTGSTWSNGKHSVDATIYAPKGSTAIKYAKNKGINYVATKIKIGKVVLSSVKSVDHNTIEINWKKTLNAKKYQVWRANAKKDKYKLIATTEANSFRDKQLVTGKKYYYKVRAINGNIKGAYSVIKYNVPKLKRTTGLNVDSTENTVLIEWNKVNGASGYQIFKAGAKGGTYKKIATIAGVSFTDKSVRYNTNYYYKVRAYKKVNNQIKYGRFSVIKPIKTKNRDMAVVQNIDAG